MPTVKKKRLESFVDAVSAILGDQEKAKKLKKAKALKRFIAKLEDRQRDIEKEIAKGDLSGKSLKTRSRQAENLEKQIKKGRKILSDMR